MPFKVEWAPLDNNYILVKIVGTGETTIDDVAEVVDQLLNLKPEKDSLILISDILDLKKVDTGSGGMSRLQSEAARAQPYMYRSYVLTSNKLLKFVSLAINMLRRNMQFPNTRSQMREKILRDFGGWTMVSQIEKALDDFGY